MERSPDCIVTIDHHGRILEYTPAAEITFGYRREQALGRDLAELILPPSLTGRFRRRLAGRPAANAANRGKPFKLVARRADGTEFPIVMTVVRLPSAVPPMFAAFVRHAIVANLRDTTPQQLIRELARRVERMDRIAAITADLNRVRSLQEVLPIIGQTALTLSGADQAAVWLHEPGGTVACPWRQGLSDEYVAELLARLNSRPGPRPNAEHRDLSQSPAAPRAPRSLFARLINALPRERVRIPGGHEVETFRPVLAGDVGSLPSDAFLRHLADAGGYRAVGLWPLTYAQSVVAVVGCYYDAPHEWAESERGVFQVFCIQAAVAIQNARQHEAQAKERAEQEALYDLSRRLRIARTSEEIYSLLCDRAVSVLHGDYVAINIVDHTCAQITRVHAAGPFAGEAPRQSLPLAGSWSERVTQTGASVVGEDYWAGRSSGWAPARAEHFGPYAVVPLRSAEEIVGTFIATRRRAPAGRPFTPEEIRLMEAIGEIGAAAILRARLDQDLLRQVGRLQTLHDLSGRLRATQTPEEMYPILCEPVVSSLHAAYIAINLVDHAREQITRVHAAGAADDEASGQTYPVAGTRSERVLQTGTTLVGEDYWTGRLNRWAPACAERLGPYAIVPLRSEKEVIGTFIVTRLRTPAGLSFTPEEISLLESIAEIGGTAIRRARLNQDLHRQVDRLRALQDLSRRLHAARTLDDIYAILVGDAMSHFSAPYGTLALLDPDRRTLTRAYTVGAPPDQPGSTFPVAGSWSERVLHAGKAQVTADIHRDGLPPVWDRPEFRRFGPFAFVPVRSEEETIGMLVVARLREPDGRPFTDEEVRLLEAFAERGGAAILRVQLYQDLRGQIERLKALYEVSKTFAESLDLQQLAADAVRACVERFGVQAAWLGRAEPAGPVRPFASYPVTMKVMREIVIGLDNSAGGQVATARALRTGRPAVTNDITQSPHRPPWYEHVRAEGLRSVAGFPLISRTRTFGVLALYSNQAGFFTPERIEFFQSYAHQLAAALENARLFADAGRRLEQLQAQRSIDMAISSNLDLRLTLNILVERAVTQLGVDAADVLSFDARSQTLNFAAGRGFRTAALQHTHLRLGEGYAGRAALDRSLVAVGDLATAPEGFARAPLLVSEGFVAYHAVPLIAKGQLNGVLEVFHRGPLVPDQEWLDLLEAIAGQAAIAIENTTMLNDLQHANVELVLAYDHTIEGWSRALDLRDKETEGHAQRVAELTLRLAREMHVSDAEFVHFRRGALLHDIGKMGIPDEILLKPGPLTDEEWVVMRRHPIYAYELLSPIAYLRPALDIPYCHHEKWDGTGYPRGLKGEQIPLAARIFAVIDVWDALCSDRPYRPAWTKEQAMEYILAQSSVHFDPAVVDAFARIIRE